MRSLVGASLLIAFLLFAAGCVGPAGGGADSKQARLRAGGHDPKLQIGAGWAEAVFPVGDHNHRNWSQHKGLSTPNFKLIGHNPLTTDYHGKSAGGYFCGDVRESNGRRLSVVHSWVSDVAFVISDVTDPTNPQKIGELVMANTHVYDIALTPDMKWVLASTSPGTQALGNDPSGGEMGTAKYEPGSIFFRDACTGQETPVKGPEQGLPYASGVVLIDINNPRNPAIADFRFIPMTGGHSVRVETKDGKDLILISVTSGLPVTGNPTGYYYTASYWLMDFLDTAAGRKMEFLSQYQFPAKSTPVPMLKVPSSLHDGFLQKHPITGQWLAYLGAGDSGIAILNVDDPRMPKLIGTWSDFKVFGEGAPTIPFVHEAQPITGLWDGHHYTFIGEECGARKQTPTCLVAMLDTTDPTKITFVSGWTLPFQVEWNGGGGGGAVFSLHYVAIQNRTLFITVYHAGVWAIDLSTPESIKKMPSVGVFMPDILPPKGTVYPNHVYHWTPVVLDALPISDGNMIVYDGTSGLYVVKFDATNPAPPPTPWPFPFNQ
jgi:hypothetical protein